MSFNASMIELWKSGIEVRVLMPTLPVGTTVSEEHFPEAEQEAAPSKE